MCSHFCVCVNSMLQQFNTGWVRRALLAIAKIFYGNDSMAVKSSFCSFVFILCWRILSWVFSELWRYSFFLKTSWKILKKIESSQVLNYWGKKDAIFKETIVFVFHVVVCKYLWFFRLAILRFEDVTTSKLSETQKSCNPESDQDVIDRQ